MGVFVSHFVLLTVHWKGGQEISENLITDMECPKSTEDFLREVDEDLVVYVGKL